MPPLNGYDPCNVATWRAITVTAISLAVMIQALRPLPGGSGYGGILKRARMAVALAFLPLLAILAALFMPLPLRELGIAARVLGVGAIAIHARLLASFGLVGGGGRLRRLINTALLVGLAFATVWLPQPGLLTLGFSLLLSARHQRLCFSLQAEGLAEMAALRLRLSSLETRLAIGRELSCQDDRFDGNVASAS